MLIILNQTNTKFEFCFKDGISSKDINKARGILMSYLTNTKAKFNLAKKFNTTEFEAGNIIDCPIYCYEFKQQDITKDGEIKD